MKKVFSVGIVRFLSCLVEEAVADAKRKKEKERGRM